MAVLVSCHVPELWSVKYADIANTIFHAVLLDMLSPKASWAYSKRVNLIYWV